MDKTRRRLLAVLGTTSIATLAGCSGDGDSGQSGGASLSLQQQAKLAADDGDEFDSFGTSVALSDDGSTAIIGASGHKGSAYVFSQTGGTWQQQAKLAADDGDYRDWFGNSVAVSDDGSTAIIGARYDEDPNGNQAGSAYVFLGTGGDWQQQAKFAADDGDEDDHFGESVAVAGGGSTTIIGAPWDEDPAREGAGSAYVFSQAGGAWEQQAKLAADDGDELDYFGTSVALSDDGSTAIIGAPGDEDPNGNQAGSVYVFSQAGGTWQQQAKLAADDGDEDDYFGVVALSRDGSTAIIGTPSDEDPNGDRAGSAYVFA